MARILELKCRRLASLRNAMRFRHAAGAVFNIGHQRD